MVLLNTVNACGLLSLHPLLCALVRGASGDEIDVEECYTIVHEEQLGSFSRACVWRVWGWRVRE